MFWLVVFACGLFPAVENVDAGVAGGETLSRLELIFSLAVAACGVKKREEAKASSQLNRRLSVNRFQCLVQYNE